MKRKDNLPRQTIYITCNKCNDLIGSYGYKKHYNKCIGINKNLRNQREKNKLINFNVKEINNEYLCLECNKKFSKMGIGTHYVSMHTGRIRKPSYGMLGKKGSNQFLKAKKLNLEKPEITQATKIKLSNANKDKIRTIEIKEKISKAMQLAVINNPDSYSSKNVCGRVKNIEYNGFTLKGSWELLIAKALDESNIEWTNIIKPIKYFWNDSWHLYFPDFYLKKFNLYLEIKGYETERDLKKWEAMKDKNFFVIKNIEIKKIKNNINIKEILPILNMQEIEISK